MLLIPAIDLKEGQCVRLRQGRMDDATVFSKDPVAMAAHWREQGARRLHIVDLDGAFAGEPRNRSLIEQMVAVMDGIPVQVGGGIRSIEVVEAYVAAGVSGVIVGTKAIQEPEFLMQAAKTFPAKIWFGLDARNGLVATEGWDQTSSLKAVDLAQQAAQWPVAGVVYTDIERDGMMSGLNIEATLTLALASNLPVVASGGVTTLSDLEALKQAFTGHESLLFGAITGRAIYEGTLDVAAGQALLDG
ncbi:MAG: 1-(5-phosphoribosyl)-5-[(5-phosphoribosylamino)methylideneamino]imidazole-4-carboxamide isomerase [Pseudomonadaceae bacterium]|nr:1-(5-phosphoribosyl)-5-[(5-phosphoribosylamino)methylideneamino]imidazole-4-carboxamide isomerase [Pseudomonadaceae bacterium]